MTQSQSHLPAGQRHRLVILCLLFIFALTYWAPVTYTRSDPHLSLFVSQALIQHGTLRLDMYRDRLDEELDSYAVRERGGHLTYYFPPGPSLFAAPFVGLANLIGWDMTVTAHNHRLQKLLASLICALIFLMLYKTARCYLSESAALVIAFVSTLGSVLVSSLGAALWNANFAVLFIGLILWMLARTAATGETMRPAAHPYLLGLLLFAAFISRPTSLAFILPLMVYLLILDRLTFFKAGLTLAALMGGFLLLSRWQYGQWLPAYYSLERFDRSVGVGRVLYGHLLSPSRGLLIFSPFFIPVFIGVAVYFRRLAAYPLFWLSLTWLTIHLVAMSRIGHWWGGHSYGPRLLADAVPAVIMLTVLLWHAATPVASPALRKIAILSFLALGMLGVFINSYQGLYNPSTLRWNDYPNIDQFPEYVFDWRYPQFLASPKSLEERYQSHLQLEQAREMDEYPVTGVIM